MKIREMTDKDLKTAAELCAELGYPTTLDEMRDRWRAVSGSPADKVLVMEGAKEEIVGFAHFARELSLTGSARYHLKSLVIHETLRGGGLGAQLLAAAEEHARKMQTPKMRVGSQTKRTDAHRFYERLGYKILKTWHVFEKPL